MGFSLFQLPEADILHQKQGNATLGQRAGKKAMMKAAFERWLFLKWARWRASPRVAGWYQRRADQFHQRQQESGHRWEQVNFRIVHGYWPDLHHPRRYREKTCCKKLFDRDPLLPVIADKHRVRDFLRDRLGKAGADSILIPQLFVTDDPGKIPFDELTGNYVIKANHGSRMNIFVREGEPVDRELVRARLRLWLACEYGTRSNQWCYWTIPRLVVIERMLLDESGQIPPDVKIDTYGGIAKLVTLIRREGAGKSLFYYDRDLKLVEAIPGPGGAEPPAFAPPELAKAVEIAERLSAGFDHLRADFYLLGGRIYFGELTNYPGGGLKRDRSAAFDIWRGQLWSETQTYLPRAGQS